MLALRVIRRPGAADPDPTALALPAEGLTIGRADECGLVLADPLRLVSRQHAQVVPNGQGASVRCISSSSALWVNGEQLASGGERALVAGDRLRIGGFEISVEAAVQAAPQRSRLDRWFDLDSAGDPLAAESPLPALPPSPAAPVPAPMATPSAVVSWQTSRHQVRPAVVAPPQPMQPASPEAPPRAVRRPPPPAPTPVPERLPPSAAPATPVPTPMPSLQASAPQAAAEAPGTDSASAPAPRASRRARPAAPATDLQELAAAFRRGAGLEAELPLPTPEWMQHLGELMRAAAEGTLALLQSRSVAKRHMRAEGTHIAPRQNNPLKFSPDASEALTRMLRRDASPGFLDPVAALRDAHRDLLVHQVAMVAGMRAAVFELFSRLGPEAAENAEGPASGLAQLVPALHAAALWQRHCMQHAQLLEHLDDDFETIFGREFLRAYEAQSRVVDEDDATPPPEAPWPPAR